MATGIAAGCPTMVVAVLRPSRFTATRWRNWIFCSSLSLARYVPSV